MDLTSTSVFQKLDLGSVDQRRGATGHSTINLLLGGEIAIEFLKVLNVGCFGDRILAKEAPEYLQVNEQCFLLTDLGQRLVTQISWIESKMILTLVVLKLAGKSPVTIC